MSYRDKEKSPRIPRRDVKYPKERLLFELYRMRGLTIRQIDKAIIGSYDYTFEYMLNLEKEGLVQGKVYNNGRKRLGKLYTITDKGIERLIQADLLEVRETDDTICRPNPSLSPKFETSVTSNEFMPMYKPRFMSAYANNQGYDKHKVIYTLLTNELYSDLTSYGIHVYDSREWKTRYGLNRNAIVRGGFRALDGQEYSLYILFSLEQAQTASISENMIRRMVEEINTFQQAGHHIMYIYDDAKYDWVIEQLRSYKVHSSSLHIIRHDRGKGLEQLRLLSDSEKMRQQVAVSLEMDIEFIPSDRLAARYAQYQFTLEGESYYLLNYLTFNEGALMQLEREFTPERSKIEAHKMAILAWKSNYNILKERFGNSNHIRVRLMDDSELVNIQYTNKRLLSDSLMWKLHSKFLNNRRVASQRRRRATIGD